jgi:hypothetical protein
MGVVPWSKAKRNHSPDRICPTIETVEGRILMASTVLTQFSRVVGETSDFAVLGDAAYFFTYEAGPNGNDAATLWRSDGTPAAPGSSCPASSSLNTPPSGRGPSRRSADGSIFSRGTRITGSSLG